MCCDLDCAKGAKWNYGGVGKTGRPAPCAGVEGRNLKLADATVT